MTLKALIFSVCRVCVVRELLHLDYGSAIVADDEGHTPLMILGFSST